MRWLWNLLGLTPVQPTRASPECLVMIAEFEGFEPHLYNDAAGHCTIGGHDDRIRKMEIEIGRLRR